MGEGTVGRAAGGALGAVPCGGWRGVRGAHGGGHLDPIARGSLGVGQGAGVTAGCGVQGTQCIRAARPRFGGRSVGMLLPSLKHGSASTSQG